MKIAYDPGRGRWCVSQCGLPVASSIHLETLTRKFPEAKVVR